MAVRYQYDNHIFSNQQKLSQYVDYTKQLDSALDYEAITKTFNRK